MTTKITINNLKSTHSHGRTNSIEVDVNGLGYYGFAICVNGTFYINWLTSRKSEGKRQAKSYIKMEVEKILNNK